LGAHYSQRELLFLREGIGHVRFSKHRLYVLMKTGTDKKKSNEREVRMRRKTL